MENTFITALKNESNLVKTENGALAHQTTNSAVYDLFALGGAYRKRSDEDKILLFKNALEENATLALKCLFYLRDIQEGMGERDFFRICYNWLAKEYPNVAVRNMESIPTFGRWDDLYCLCETPLEFDAFYFIKRQFMLDLNSTNPSLLGKWLKSQNASSKETKRLGKKTREYLGLTERQYRKALSQLREKIKVVEKLMSENRWEEIEFEKVPSKAGLIYRNAFKRKDIISDRYEKFINSTETRVHADTLYPYEVIHKAVEYVVDHNKDDVIRKALEKYWNNLPNYFKDKPCNILCMVDTSGSMLGIRGDKAPCPLDAAIGLGMYCAERNRGAFKDCYISFSRNPKLIKVEGIDFIDKVKRIYDSNLYENTDLIKAFKMLKEIAFKSNKEDIPKTIVVISDMQIDEGSYFNNNNEVKTQMENMRCEWAEIGLEMPHLVYWNVEARGNANFLDNGENVTYVSGLSPVIFEQIISGFKGIDLCLEKLNSKRYECIK